MSSTSSHTEAILKKWVPEGRVDATHEGCDPTKIECSRQNKRRNCTQDVSKIVIGYDAFSTPSHLRLPRKYTNIHNDETEQIFCFIGSEYNKEYLESEEARLVQSQVMGKWVKSCSSPSGYKIKLAVLVSTPENPFPFFRNFIFCREMYTVLQGFALAESALLARHPELKETPIEIHFKSTVPAYDRKEQWKTLGYWVCDGKC